MDLTTSYLGLELRSPLVASASPVGAEVSTARAAADAGVGAIVLPSFFEEQARRQEAEDLRLIQAHEDAYSEASSYFPDAPSVAPGGAGAYLAGLERMVDALEIPVIASLNGATSGGWTNFARSMESAGAAAIELNVYAVPGATAESGADVDARHVAILRGVRDAVSIPVSVKLSPFFSSTAAVARELVEAGADGLVLFNRFYQPDVDVETLRVSSSLTLSRSEEGRLPRTWIAILRNQLQASLAATTGVYTGADVAAYLLAGADVVMTASALLAHGPTYAATLLAEFVAWAERKEFDSVSDLRGLLAIPAGADVSATERAGYVGVLARARETYGAL